MFDSYRDENGHLSFKNAWLEEIHEHPFEIGLSSALILFGIFSFASGLTMLPKSIDVFPLALAFLYSILAVLGGGAVIAGKAIRYKYLWAYGLERFGLYVSSSAWGGYGLGIALAPDFSIRAVLILLALLALSVACIIRATALSRRAEAIMNVLRYAKEYGYNDRDS